MKMPSATKGSAVISGVTLPLIFMVGESIGGLLRIILGIIGTIWFLVSVIMFVLGRKPLEYNNDWLCGKRSYWEAQKKLHQELLSGCCQFS